MTVFVCGVKGLHFVYHVITSDCTSKQYCRNDIGMLRIKMIHIFISDGERCL